MTLLLLVLMGFHLQGEIIHEWAGIIFTLLIILHLYLNRRRLWLLSMKIPLSMRIVNRAINVVTFVVILTAIVSGMMLSPASSIVISTGVSNFIIVVPYTFYCPYSCARGAPHFAQTMPVNCRQNVNCATGQKYSLDENSLNAPYYSAPRRGWFR